MKVVASEPTGDVDDLSDEEEAGDSAGLHGFGVQLCGVDSAGGNFGFAIAFGASGGNAPGVELGFKGGDGGVGKDAL